jgi:hypothetical protein
MATQASGTFEVKLTPQPPDDPAAKITIGRMSINKQFHGDLEGVSQGQMLAVTTDVQGSAGYVAMEQFTGALLGCSGSFTLQHSSTMTRGAPQQNIIVTPDSGTDQLAGLTGKMTIRIADGKHFYDFEYMLAETS